LTLSIFSYKNTQLIFCVSTDKQLPVLKSSNNVIDKSQPLPTSLMSDFIPEDVLFALTQPPPVKDQLGPPSRTRNLNTSTVSHVYLEYSISCLWLCVSKIFSWKYYHSKIWSFCKRNTAFTREDKNDKEHLLI